jgi:hypothetical protein
MMLEAEKEKENELLVKYTKPHNSVDAIPKQKQL